DAERYQPLVEALNDVLGQRDFFDADAWIGQFIEDESREWIEQGTDRLSEEQVRRLNRLLLSRALRPDLNPAEQSKIETRYGPWRIDFLTATTTQQQLARELSGWVSYIFDKFVLSIGLVIAILVTSNMVPEMFEPGSLNLLLSKPISRTWLLISKFVGGCAFVALLASYLFTGLWLWLGWEMGVWDRSILLSIPLYVLVFAMYFAVSVLVGVMWRSAVLSVIMTALFWAFCFVIGLVYSLFYNRTIQERIVTIVPGPTLEIPLVADALQRVWKWEPRASQWQVMTRLADRPEEEAGFMVSLFFVTLPVMPGAGPVFDTTTHTYLRAAMNFSDRERIMEYPLEVAPADNLEFVKTGRLPANVVALVPARDALLVLTEQGRMHRLDLVQWLPAWEEAKPDEPAESIWSNWSDALRNREGGLSDFIRPLGPDQPQPISDGRQVAWIDQTQELAIADRGTVYIYRLDGDGMKLVREQQFETGGRSASLTTWIAVGGPRGLLTLGNGKLIVFDWASLKPLAEFLPESRSAPTQVAASPNGTRFAVNFRNGTTWLIDASGEPWCRRLHRPQSHSHHGVSFADNDRLWVSYDFDRLALISLPSGTIERDVRPQGDILKSLMRWFVRPVYRVCPKPGEFYKLVNYLSSTSDTRYNPDVDLNEVLEFEDPWSPLTTGLVFMAFCLALACWIFQRTDY
ncbi:MAG TPA: ABC transporter permease, partial [Pirellulaceae bacterium]|nr:ABC transporter permease [Pirellulaceae bacterium]